MNVGKMKPTMLVVVLLAGCAAQTNTVRSSTGLPVRAIEAASLFGEFCLEAPPSFQALNHRAAGLQVFEDRPISPGARQKGWLIPSPNGPLLLTVEGAPDNSLSVVVCGVSATGASGRDLQRWLSLDARLGAPVKIVSPAPGGGTLVFWSAKFSNGFPAADAQVMLAFDVAGLGVNPINLTFRRHRFVGDRPVASGAAAERVSR